ncbi:MAG: endonuclease/exonuclease/phosphatase family protein [Reinekea sp.]|nr:endonuclease/exonuclease/phosphatase family protein [Reinekea sp.]
MNSSIKQLLLYCFGVIGILQGSTLADEPLAIHIASFNIHYIVPNSPKENWDHRKYAVRDVIQEMRADIIAFQEMETFTGGHYNGKNLQLDWVLENFPHYQAGAFGDPSNFPITQPILYDQRKFELTDQGFLFFSPTPDVIYSRQWDGRYPYYATWVELRQRLTGLSFVVVNLHNDYKSRSNRLASSQVVIEHLGNRLKLMPSVVVGDFNAPKSFKEVTLFAELGLEPLKPDGSTNRILGLRLLPAIDHILISDGWESSTQIRRWTQKYDGHYPSDHFPISAEIRWRSQL